MNSNIDWVNGPLEEPSELDIIRRVVVQHVADGLHSGNEVAAALARSLVTELDAAGIDISTAVNALRAEQADEQRAASV